MVLYDASDIFLEKQIINNINEIIKYDWWERNVGLAM